MKSSALAAGFALLALALPCSAQEIPSPMPPANPGAPCTDKRPIEVKDLGLVPPAPPGMVLEEALVGDPITPPQYPHVWMDFDGVLWWLKPNYINVPLVTTTRTPQDLAVTQTTGGLSDPNTVVLFGNQSVSNDPFTGGRLRIGAALDTEATEAFEVSGYYLPWQIDRFAISSNASGYPALALPFNQVFPTQVETSTIVAGQFGTATLHGSIAINNGTELWGGEANYTQLISTSRWGEFDGIIGFRYMHLEDYLTIDAETDQADGGGTTHDRFATRNSFYGGQVGLRYLLDFENWRIESICKIAAGDTDEALDISGSANLPQYALFSTKPQLPGGFYTASSNIGNSSTNRFGLVSEVDCNVSYKVTDNFQLTAGYTYMYWNDVYRSGNQIDHNLNPTLNPALSTINTAGGPAVPQRLNAESSFWAQGITVGFRLTF